MNVIGVARQSRTADDSASVPEQIKRMESECERQGAKLVAVYTEEDVSGQRPLERRHGLKQAVLDIEGRRADVVMTAYFDRLVRSLKTQAEVVDRVEAANGHVVTLDVGQISNGTAAKWLSSSMLGMVAEYYARSVGERLAEGKQRNIDQGVPPFPFVTPAYRRREDGTLEQDPEGAPLVKQAIAMRLANPPASYASIAKWLTNQGMKISVHGVTKMFASRLLVGEIHFGNFKPNLHAIDEPLIDHATFHRLHATKASRGRYAKSPRLLARLGILRCESCGARLTVDSSLRGRGAKRKVYDYYRCGNRVDCPAPAIVSADLAEQVVWDKTIELSAQLKGRASAKAEVEQARIAVEQADERLDEAIRTLAGLTDRAASRETLAALQADRDAKADHHARLAARLGVDRTVTTADADLTDDERRDLIRALISAATVAPGRGVDRIHVLGQIDLLG